MNNDNINMYLTANAKYFEASAIPMIKAKLELLTDEQYAMLQAVSLKDPMMMLIISLFGGSLGIDRFMLGDTGLGVLKLLTSGGCGLWTIADWFSVCARTKAKNLAEIYKVI